MAGAGQVTVSSELVKSWARDLGFAACGVARPDPSARTAELGRWLAAGYGGTMRYLHRQARRRREPQQIEPSARAVIVVLDNYYYQKEPAGPKVARYARGDDYHRVMGRRLGELANRLLAAGACAARYFVDAGPVPERELAERAGLGWIGKNSMLIRPGAGSWFFIGSIFTDLALAPDAPFVTDHCGTCTRCLDACPTEAFVAPRVLDATRCISYLTIEQRGPIPDDLAERLGGWVFGCDVCNDVCPWNIRFASETGIAGYRPAGRLDDAPADHFDGMNEAEFTERYGDSPLARPGLAGMRRNFKAAGRSRTVGNPEHVGTG